jgi:DNA-binding NtrC family response regulator
MADPATILVIEDNDFVRMQIVKFLQGDAYETVEVDNVKDGIIAIENNSNIQCALVDVRMEPEDGFDFINKLQAQSIKIPVILVTGDDNPDVLSKASSMHVASVLMKPVNKDRLLKMVNRAIAGSGQT